MPNKPKAILVSKNYRIVIDETQPCNDPSALSDGKTYVYLEKNTTDAMGYLTWTNVIYFSLNDWSCYNTEIYGEMISLNKEILQ